MPAQAYYSGRIQCQYQIRRPNSRVFHWQPLEYDLLAAREYLHEALQGF